MLEYRCHQGSTNQLSARSPLLKYLGVVGRIQNPQQGKFGFSRGDFVGNMLKHAKLERFSACQQNLSPPAGVLS